jgi:hypothetical protein
MASQRKKSDWTNCNKLKELSSSSFLEHIETDAK